MKITIEFDNPEEAQAALNAPLLISALKEIRERVRARDKYGDFQHQETVEEVETIYTMICDKVYDGTRGLDI